MAENINIAGRLHSTATGNVVAGANEIYDDAKGKKQSVVNHETDAALDDRYTKSQTYNKTELNSMITTPNQEYVSVTATDQTTAATDVLPATGSADTTYRVGNWDGSQFDASVYSEYAWDGSQYVHLSTKTQVGEVFDISAYHATGGTLATYADLAAALDSNNGGGVPQSLQKGGMSVKFVHTSDNNYVKFFCTAQNFTIDVTKWQGVDDEPTAGSENLVKSGGVVKHLADNIGKYYDPALWTLIGNGLIDDSGKWVIDNNATSKYLKIDNIRQHKLIIKANVAYNSIVSFVKEINFLSGSSPIWANGESGRHVILPNTTETFTIPDDANYAIFRTKDGTDRTPSSVCCIDGKLVEMESFEQEFAFYEHIENPQSWEDVGYYSITSDGKWARNYDLKSKFFSAIPYRGHKMAVTANNIGVAIISFVKTVNAVENADVDFATGETGRHVIAISSTETYIVPSDANYVVVNVINNAQDRTPTIKEMMGKLGLGYEAYKNTESFSFCNVANLRYYPNFIQGSIRTDGQYIGETIIPVTPIRIHSLIDVYLYKGDSLYCYAPNEYEISYRTWDGISSSMSAPSDWLSGFVTIPKTEKYIAITLRKTNGGTIAPSDGNNIRIYVNPEINEIYQFIGPQKIGSYPYRYSGEKLNFGNEFKPALYKKLSDWHDMQGGAVYGDYLVCVMATDEMVGTVTENGYIYNIKTGERVCSLLFGSTLGTKVYEMPHANQVSFGSKFYNSSSRFPLLYVSQVNGGSTTLWNRSERGVLVYDLQTEDDGETFTPVLVQAIIPDLSTIDPQTNKPVMEKYIGKYTPNYVYDTDKDQLVVLGYPNESWFNLNGGQPIAIFDAPLISDGEEVVLTESDVVDSYKLPVSLIIQQSFYKNGRIYISGGMANSGSIRVLDLLSRNVITFIDLTQWSNVEPQFIGLWEDRLLYYTAGTTGNIYEILYK